MGPWGSGAQDQSRASLVYNTLEGTDFQQVRPNHTLQPWALGTQALPGIAPRLVRTEASRGLGTLLLPLCPEQPGAHTCCPVFGTLL